MTPDEISRLLQPYVEAGSPAVAGEPDWPRIYAQLAVYLELILKWNARINLTAIRTPEEIVRRHFGESLFAGLRLGACSTLLDFGSGAGFPGVPIQLLRPDVQVTLAESRTRKATFLREVLRTLDLSTEVWPNRVQAMHADRQFDAVAMRAVDDMVAAVGEAAIRASDRVVIIGTARLVAYPALATDFNFEEPVALPESPGGVLLIARRR